ncbi:hypothetical protein [Williamsia sp. 1135]|uniref:hypothetical protein n=1 Tax=Williamsia sp. 1135 TaxID=1889262 RepID=UPI0011801773|nr:hypothetical protein [Williamsia sp. 1135]
MSDGGGSQRLRTLGDAAWWVFIVASLIAGGVTWLAGERYVPFVPPSIGAGTDVAYSGSYSRFDGVVMADVYSSSETTNCGSPQIVEDSSMRLRAPRLQRSRSRWG